MLFHLYHQRRMYLLPCLVLAFTCTTVRAADVMEQAQMKVFFVDAYLSTITNTCAQKYPELRQQLQTAQQAFHQRLLPDIERGREVGRALAAPRGKNIDQEAQRLAERTAVTSFLTSPSLDARQLCQEVLLKEKSPIQWSMNDFLRDDFESLKMEVGNRQGLPCDMIPTSAEGLARRFLELRGSHPEMAELAGSLLHLDLGELKRKTSNCLAVQARAAEYRVPSDKELEAVGDLLSSMEAVLTPMFAPPTNRIESIGTVADRVDEYLREREKK